MINADSRLHQDLTANEYFLLTYLTSKINAERVCWYGNKTICKDLKWSMVRYQNTKKSLIKKGLIQVTPRFKGKDPSQTTNFYKILTPLTSNYTPTSKLDKGDTSKLGMGDALELDSPPTSNLGMAPTSKSGNEVLVTEVLSNEELESEELEKRKKQKDLFFKSLVYKCLIDCVYPQYEEYSNYYLGWYDFAENPSNRIEKIQDPTVKAFLEKIWAAGENLLNAFEQIARQRPRFVAHLESQEYKIIRDKSPKAIDEAEFQIKAYVDFCRISGRYLTTDPNKLPAKLLECDWVTKLHELVKPQMESWKYDPVYDDELHSHWLVELYYWEMIYDGYKCKRQENRIVFDGEEYRKVNSIEATASALRNRTLQKTIPESRQDTIDLKIK